MATQAQLRLIFSSTTLQSKCPVPGCRASCVDWYGNSQPLFVHGRVIALLGYELVEGTLENGQIQEKRRINYGPQSL
jgi:hypothetical protein